jgi:hypothetical protein
MTFYQQHPAGEIMLMVPDKLSGLCPNHGGGLHYKMPQVRVCQLARDPADRPEKRLGFRGFTHASLSLLLICGSYDAVLSTFNFLLVAASEIASFVFTCMPA